MNQEDSERISLSSAKQRRTLLSRLRQAWNSRDIHPQFQNAFEECLNFCTGHLFRKEVERQIALIESQQSVLFVLAEVEQKRQEILQRLQKSVKYFQSIRTKTQQNVSEICKAMHQLRNANLQYAQALLSLIHYFEQQTSTSITCEKIGSLFLTLQEDISFLPLSLMRKYIVFSKNFDPFFLKHYQILATTDNPRLKQLPCIEDLFNIPLPLGHRLKRIQQQLNKYLNLAQMRQTKNFISRQSSSKQYHTQRQKYLKYSNEEATSRYNNQVYLQNRSIRTDCRSPTEHNRLTVTRQTRMTLADAQRRKWSSPPPEDMQNIPNKGSFDVIRFPKINAISSDKSIAQDMQKQGQKSPNRGSMPPLRRNKKAVKKSLNLVETQEEQFQQYISSKRFRATNFQSTSPNVRIRRRKTVNKTSMSPESVKKPEEKVQQLEYMTVAIQTLPVQADQPSRQAAPLRKEASSETQKYGKIVTRDRANGATKKEKAKQEHKEPQNRQVDDRLSKNEASLSPQSPHTAASQQVNNQPKSAKKQPKQLGSSPPQQQQKTTPQQKELVKPSLSPKKQQINEKRYKLRASEKQVTVKQLFANLKQYKIKPEYRSKFEIGNWQNSIAHNQYYLHKSFLNDVLQAVSLCCALPEGDIMIKYWGPLQVCDDQMSNFLFSKYLEHLERNSTLKSVYYNALPIKELALNSFIKRKERIFERERVHGSMHQPNYTHFLEVLFTNIAISKITKNQDELMNQEKVQQFQSNKFLIFNYLLIINKLMHPGAFSSIASYHPKLSSVVAAKETILSHYLSDEAYNSSFKCQYCNLLALRLRTPIFSAFFIADQGYIKLAGQICFEDQNTLIVSLQMLKHNTKIYFGKGIKAVASMVEKVKNRSTNKQKIEFTVRMFKKKIRGRINCINLKDQTCFGDLQINFTWKDYLKGKISHPVKDASEIFDQQFYCLIQTQREILFAFQVLPQNFVNP